MAHEREIKEEQLFLDLALTALDHMRDEAGRSATVPPWRT